MLSRKDNGANLQVTLSRKSLCLMQAEASGITGDSARRANRQSR